MAVLEENQDLILVPAGLLIMLFYHFYLFFRVLRYPATTAIGYENHNWMGWVERMMQGDMSYVNLALTVLSSSTSSANDLASMCLTLSSFMGVWVGNSSSDTQNFLSILGKKNMVRFSIKNVSMLITFMLAFGAFIQAVRHFVQANSLISMPNKDVPVSYVQRLVIRGNYFWHVGLRMLYFAMVLFFWSFGPMPMFASSVILVILLFIVDSNREPLHLFRPLVKGLA